MISVDDRPGMRISRFYPLDTWRDLDRHLRGLMPGLAAQESLVEAWAGRSGQDSGNERVVVSMWASAAAEAQAPTVTTIFDVLDQTSGAITGERTDVVAIAVQERFERTRPMSLLRVYEGRTRPGELGTYLQEIREGVLRDGSQAHGPGALTCGSRDPVEFVTASLWPDWESIQSATGGDIRNPLATRNTARLVAGKPTHFELIAEVVGSGQAASPADARRDLGGAA